MIEDLPNYISLLFGITVLVTIVWFYVATYSRSLLLIVIIWTIIQSILGLTEFYNDTETIPPRLIIFGILPTIIGISITFLIKKGRSIIQNTNLKSLTYFHSIRIPVEIVLALLYYQGFVSVYMTYEGTNFDLLSGITAPIIGYLAFRTGVVNKKLLIAWNILCLLLLFNVVITAAFAIPSSFQQISYDQPNVAVLFFPFNLLPTVVVPLVLFGHLIAFKQLTLKR